MKKIIIIAVLSLMAFAAQAQQLYDTVIYIPQEVKNCPTVWNRYVPNRGWYEHFDITWLTRPQSDSCLWINGIICGMKLCDEHHKYIENSPSMLQLNGFAQPYHCDSTLAIIGIAPHFFGEYWDSVDVWKDNACLMLRLQDTNFSTSFDSVKIRFDTIFHSRSIYDSPGYKMTDLLDSSAHLNCYFFRDLEPKYLKDFCLSLTAEHASNYAIIDGCISLNHTLSFIDTACSGENTGCYTGYSPYFKLGPNWIKFSEDSIYRFFQSMHIVILPVVLKPHVASLSQTELNAMCSVFPNPAKNKLSFQSEYKVNDIQIIDILGKVVLKKQINNFSAEVIIKALPMGTYILQLNTDKGTAIKQVVIE